MANPKPPKPSEGMPAQSPGVDPADLIRKNRPPPIKRFDGAAEAEKLPRIGNKAPRE